MDAWRILQDRGPPKAAWRCVSERRPNVSAILLLGLGLLGWAGPASAQQGIVTHSLMVSIHPAVHLT